MQGCVSVSIRNLPAGQSRQEVETGSGLDVQTSLESYAQPVPHATEASAAEQSLMPAAAQNEAAASYWISPEQLPPS